MASDEEIARQVRMREQAWSPGSGADTASEELQEYKRTAGEIHDELARRIRSVGEDAADEEDLVAVIERMDRLESRLDDLEDRL